MLSGRYPSEDFAELRPRLVWQRDTGVADRPPGSAAAGGDLRRAPFPTAACSGSSWSARAMPPGRHAPGRRVGELDEEMVYETRVGDVFTLGTTSWRVEQITHDQVLVSPAPGSPGRLPFWKGDSPGRPLELGRAFGAVRPRGRGAGRRTRRTARLPRPGLDEFAARNLVSYLAEQQAATGALPTDQTVVFERFRDELGDWRVCVHCALGTGVLTPWALAVEQAARERYGMEVQATATNDGMVLRVPDTESEPPSAELIICDPELLESVVTDEVGGSALFAARFRESAARALLLPRRDPKSRSPLWQQRMRSAQLLTVAAQYPEFPIVLETMRECLTDVFDLDGLLEVQRQIAGRVHADRRGRDHGAVAVRPVAAVRLRRGLRLRGRRAAGREEGRRAVPGRHPAGRAAGQGRAEAAAGRRGHRQHRGRPAGSERRSGRSVAPGAAVRPAPDRGPVHPGRAGGAQRSPASIPGPALQRAGRATGGWSRCGSPARRWSRSPRMCPGCGTVWASRCRRGWRPRFTEPAAHPIDDLVLRWARTHGPFVAATVAERYGLGRAVVEQACEPLVGPGTLIAGSFVDLPGDDRPGADASTATAQVLALIKRRTLALLRKGVEPVEQVAYARFLAEWQGIGPAGRGVPTRCCGVIEQLSGYAAAGQRRGVGHPAGPGGGLHARACWTSSPRRARCAGSATARSASPTAGSACTSPTRSRIPPSVEPAQLPQPGTAGCPRRRVAPTSSTPCCRRASADRTGPAYVAALWDLVWAGLVTGDTFAPVRSPGQRRRAPAPAGRPPGPTGPGSPAAVSAGRSGPRGSRPRPPPVAGRWCYRGDAEPADRLAADVFAQLDRYGVVTRGSVLTENSEGGFGAAYRALSSLEESGQCRRGYFVGGSRRGAVRADRSRRPAPGPATGAGAAAGAWCWPPATRPTRTVPRCRGRSGRVIDRAARPARWWCWSTVRWSSTSSAAARRCCPSPRTQPRLAPAADALARAVQRASSAS